MIEQFLTPQEFVDVWCQDAKGRDPERAKKIMDRIDPYAEALIERLNETGLTPMYFIHVMTAVAMLEQAFEAKYKGATQ